MTIYHETYDNDDQGSNLCLECNKTIDDGMFYCDECSDQLEKQGFFEIDDDFE